MWTPKELKALIELRTQKRNYREIGDALGRTAKATWNFAKRQGLIHDKWSPTREKKRDHRSDPRRWWTNKELKHLGELINKGYTTREAAFVLNRPHTSVCGQICRHKLRIVPKKRPWTEEEKEIVRQNRTMPGHALGDLLGRTVLAVAWQRHRLKAPFIYSTQRDLSTYRKAGKARRMTEADLIESLNNEKRAEA